MAKIAILGAGAVGTALARNWSSKGHEITQGVRDTNSETARAASDALGSGVALAAFETAIAGTDAVVLALPWQAVAPVLQALDGLDGKVLIDATNSLGMTDDGFGLVLGHTTSGGEQVAQLAPGAHVVKSLNQVGAEIMVDPGRLLVAPTMFVAGDDDAARTQALSLVEDLGFDAQDFGPLKGVRLLEAFAMTWIHMAISKNTGRGWAFARINAEGNLA